jgi:hypothetical protein
VAPFDPSTGFHSTPHHHTAVFKARQLFDVAKRLAVGRTAQPPSDFTRQLGGRSTELQLFSNVLSTLLSYRS